ncbi:hypothetical protein GTP56_09935 [Duganella sp. FT134W]|uniref:DUF1640 domain-containing protein n=1 Tax=Duganella margarita TaxID=2692170 RepID=A0A7X4KFK3_9BURK|nr:hypothetical protein [Duganella margarita]MYM72516.1 hypothetical protein [Duganella margarita]
MNSLDILGYCKRLEAVGVPREQAEVHAQMLAEVVAQVATKDDLAALKDELHTDIVALEARLKEWVKEWVSLYVQEQIQTLKVDMLKWFITISIAQASVIIAALRYLPH